MLGNIGYSSPATSPGVVEVALRDINRLKEFNLVTDLDTLRRVLIPAFNWLEI